MNSRTARALLVALMFCPCILIYDAVGQELHHASPGLQLQFPRDHGSHPTFVTEWWYVTGQLYESGATPFRDPPRFGFQLTFFRRRLTTVPLENPWSQVYLAHAALSDLRQERLYVDARVAGGGLSAAGAKEGGLEVWNGDWQLLSRGSEMALSFTINEEASSQVTLTLVPTRGPILHGEEGFSRKGDCATCASMYYSFPALRAQGTVHQGSAAQPSSVAVHGLAWMDHEFMSNTLQSEQEGWDWFSLQNANGTQLMLFRVRGRGQHPHTISGTVVTAEGARTLAPRDIELTPLRWWQSDAGDARYPIEWRVVVRSIGFDRVLRARFAAQEVRHDEAFSPPYWEGAIASEDEQTVGYLEMTGYHRSLGALF